MRTARRTRDWRPTAATALLLGAAIVAFSVSAGASVVPTEGERERAGGHHAGVAVCVDATDAPAGLGPEAVRTALAIEARKVGRTIESCPADAERAAAAVHIVLRSTPSVAAEVRYPNGERAQVGLDVVPPLDRAAEVARFAFVGRRLGPGLALGADHAPHRVPTAPPEVESETVAIGVAVHVGGRYDHGVGQSVGAAGVEVDAGVTIGAYGALGVQALWQPERDLTVEGPPSATLQVGSVAGIGRLSLPVGPVFIRPALGAGAEWRTVAVTGPEGNTDEGSTAVLLLVEIDVVWPVWRWLRLGVGFQGKTFVTGTDWQWRETTVYDAPRVVLGGALRVGGCW